MSDEEATETFRFSVRFTEYPSGAHCTEVFLSDAVPKATPFPVEALEVE